MAQEFAGLTGEDRLKAMIAQNLGIIASMRGDLSTALDHYASSLVTYKAAGLREYVGPLLNNMGLVYTQLEQFEKAQDAYDQAVAHCDATGDATNRLLALINSTDLWLARGDIIAPRQLCDTVLLEATSATDQRALGETHKFLGIIARTQGNLETAETHFTSAFSTMRRDERISCWRPKRRANRRSCRS